MSSLPLHVKITKGFLNGDLNGKERHQINDVTLMSLVCGVKIEFNMKIGFSINQGSS